MRIYTFSLPDPDDNYETGSEIELKESNGKYFIRASDRLAVILEEDGWTQLPDQATFERYKDDFEKRSEYLLKLQENKNNWNY